MKDVVLLVAHTFNKILMEKYLFIKKQFREYGDVFILLNDEFSQIKSIPEHISCFSFTVDMLSELDYEPIEETIIPGSNHFALLYFYQYYPNYRYYWNIEYDVVFSGDWDVLFNRFINNEADFISSHIRRYSDDKYWYWWNSYNSKTIKIPLCDRIRAFNPIYRISGRSLTFLDNFLKAGNSGHHEVLIPTLLFHAGYKLSDFGGRGEFVPDGYEERFYLPEESNLIKGGTMRYIPDFFSVKHFEGLAAKLFHPVKCDILNSNLKVLAIIVTYNRQETIRRCLDSFLTSKYPVTVYIVDNASTDQTRSIIEHEYPSIILDENKKNIGFGQGNNIGFEYAKENAYDYVFLLSQDAYIEENAIYKLIEAQNNYPEYDLLSPMYYSDTEDNLNENFFRDICEGCKSYVNEQIYPSSFINAAAWLITMDCIKKIGGFDFMFFHEGESVDYYNRLVYHGFHSGIVPEAKIIHFFKSLSQLENPM